MGDERRVFDFQQRLEQQAGVQRWLGSSGERLAPGGERLADGRGRR